VYLKVAAAGRRDFASQVAPLDTSWPPQSAGATFAIVSENVHE
jgi:hypothetical protein